MHSVSKNKKSNRYV